MPNLVLWHLPIWGISRWYTLQVYQLSSYPLIFFIIIVTRSYRTFLSLASQPKGKNGRTSPKDRNFSFFFERKVNKRKKRRHARHPHIWLSSKKVNKELPTRPPKIGSISLLPNPCRPKTLLWNRRRRLRLSPNLLTALTQRAVLPPYEQADGPHPIAHEY